MPTVNRTGSVVALTTPVAPQPYTVRSGDTLNAIAARLGVSVEALVNMNRGRYPRISDPRALQAGWVLQAPTGAIPPPADWAPQPNDRVLFVAVNNSDAHRSTLESDALKARGTGVTVISPGKTPDQLTTRDASGTETTHDLKTPEGALSFALTLRLPAEQTQAIADVIQHAGDDARDEIAAIAQEWAKAERAEQIPSRFVLSGHHVGGGVYGENNGRLDWGTVANLAKAMPRAARSVEDLLIAGCYSGGQSFMDRFQAMFPNVKTIMAYEGSSPGAASGATAHQKAWEQATRGSRETITKNLFAHMRKGENVSVWTKSGGLQGQTPASLDDLRARMEEGRAQYEAALEGREVIADPQTGPVRAFYTATQRLLQHPDLPADEKARLTALRDQTIRMLFYPVISKRFGESYGQRVTLGYQALGLTPPDFTKLSRADALAAIKQFEDALAVQPQPAAAAVRLGPILQGFKALDPNVIPDTWV